jgi:hypothetical protein
MPAAIIAALTLTTTFDRQENLLNGSMTWLAMAATARPNRPDPQVGNTAAFHAKSIIATGSNI